MLDVRSCRVTHKCTFDLQAKKGSRVKRALVQSYSQMHVLTYRQEKGHMLKRALVQSYAQMHF